MRKNLLSVAVAGAIGAFALPAQAALEVATDGVGHILLVPYFSAQNGNDTLINIVNTDQSTGKAVKVRFRSALDSDDLFDFHVYLSPADVWTGKVSMNPVTGLARMETSDKSCTRPAPEFVNADFVTGRLNPAYSAEEKANQTREGYIEILTMADIVNDGTNASSTTVEKNRSLYYQTKHVNGVAPCSASVLAAVGTTTHLFADLTHPSASLMANWTIINVPGAAAYSGGATAITVMSEGSDPEVITGNRVYFDQNALQNNVRTVSPTVSRMPWATATDLSVYTADNVLLQTSFQWANYDLPDLSTPYDPAASTPEDQADALSNALLASSIANEYIVIDAVSANTDWVITMPTRRYHVAGRGRAADGVTVTTGFYAAKAESSAGPTGPFSNGDYDDLSALEQVTRYAADGRSACVRVGGYTYYDREENKPGDVPNVDVISPNTPADPTVVQLCGEVTVLGVNQTGSSSAVMGGAVAYTNLTLDSGYNVGWASLAMDNGNNDWGGIPVIGQAFVEAFNPATPGGAATYGANWQHRFTPISVD